jgi:hypothetical protein
VYNESKKAISDKWAKHKTERYIAGDKRPNQPIRSIAGMYATMLEKINLPHEESLSQ